MDQSRITVDPAVMLGKPIITGTRITVESLLERLAAGETEQQILGAHPRLSTDDIRAALRYAAESLKATAVHDHGDRMVRHFSVNSPGQIRIRR
jgi:uncharacterized protein (DUF433 family)